MKLRRACLPVSLSAALLLSFGATLPFDAHAYNYYKKNDEGWFWYHDDIQLEEEEPEEIKEPPKESPVIIMKAPEPEETTPAEPEGPSALSAAWFRDNLQTYMDRAIDNPTKENVEAYYLLQRVIMDKAQGFTDMAQKVVIGDPILDETNRRSLDPATAKLQETLSGKKRVELFNSILEKAGLAFFFSSDCALCESQARILHFLSERTGLEILPISLDGKPVGRFFADSTVKNDGHAEKLGVTEGPATFLLIPPNKWVPISYGVITQDDIITRVLTVSVDEGLITKDQFDDSRAINMTPSLADALPESGELPEDPQELIEFLRNLESK